MKLMRFDTLSIPEKASLLFCFGSLLFSIKQENYQVHLFSIDGNYFELRCNRLTMEIESVSFASYQDLDKFLQHIEIL
jgi:hypothetical protein